MPASIDAFTSATLKHLRESWWDDEFTEFLRETLRPRPGNRILDVGCGEGLAEVSLGRLHISQIRLVGIDLALSKVVEARHETASHNQRASFAAADACHLPFVEASFDSLYCVAVLQHIGDVRSAVSEFARVTVRGGRVLAVEPDNSARYLFSSVPSGRRAYELGLRLFRELAAARGEKSDTSIGPKVPALFASHGIEPIDIRLFPVSHTHIGALPPSVWAARRGSVEQIVSQAPAAIAEQTGREYLAALQAYEGDAAKAGSAFAEIQNTMLFATLGQRE
jgi:SAM-dependent methyltransferase